MGHVEMYVGNGELSGHGSGVGPTRKNMKEYCQSRQNRSVAAPIYNRGLICVRRGLPEDDSDRGDANNWKGKLTELYVTQLGRMPDEAGLAFWQAQLAGGKSWDEVSAAVIDSDEGRRRYVRELYVFLLGREPDKAGLNAWVKELAAGRTRAQVFQGFIQSEEYRQRK